ncbi:hypothetical protein EJ08DRAFT_669782 [Tothia fuscella]|uniref:DUF7924 domain-containing protein n=1 Tax=Tothia fuscella TaxID=1048955 RepID=A0A9P4NUP8_9PEZI|nr:hypothetical protein EJ08DRAFT_669782 [Tothia fuscella]
MASRSASFHHCRRSNKAKNSQKQAVKARKRAQDPENLTSLERPRKRLRTQDLLQTKPREQVEKQKRLREEDTPVYPSHEPFPKQGRKLSDRVEPPWKRIQSSVPRPRKPIGEDVVNSEQSHIGYWAIEQTWPKAYFKDNKMHHLLARKGSAASLGRKRSNPSLASFNASDERPREEKSAPYRNPSYPTFLSEDVVNYKSYMEDHELGISNASKKLLEKLLRSAQSPPKDTLFRDDVFSKHLRKLKGKNESRILQDLSPLLVPSAEALATFGADHLDGVVESVNEGWNNCFPITKPRPQPDSAFGYGTSSFSDNQLKKLRPTLGDASFSSYFKATYYMHFPFLTKEVKTGTTGLGIADNQNAHSMTVAVRAVVELFKLVGREKELHREILALAISHDDESVRLYAYYPFIDGDKVTIWRCTADRYYLDPKTKWRSWTFTTNVFSIFSPMHLKRICSAIDDISSDLTFSRTSETQSSESPQQLEHRGSTSEPSELSQQLEHHRLNDEPETPDSQKITPNTSIQTEPKSPQRKKKKKDERGPLRH